MYVQLVRNASGVGLLIVVADCYFFSRTTRKSFRWWYQGTGGRRLLPTHILDPSKDPASHSYGAINVFSPRSTSCLLAVS